MRPFSKVGFKKINKKTLNQTCPMPSVVSDICCHCYDYTVVNIYKHRAFLCMLPMSTGSTFPWFVLSLCGG